MIEDFEEEKSVLKEKLDKIYAKIDDLEGKRDAILEKIEDLDYLIEVLRNKDKVKI